MDDFKIEGLEEFQEKLKLIEKKAPDRILNELDKQGNTLRRAVRANTPVGPDKKTKDRIIKGGKLRRSWHLAEVQKTQGGYQKGMYNKAGHFHLVEKGHRKVTPGGREVGWTPGVFMLERTIAQQERPIMNDLQEWLNDLFEELK